MKKEFALATIAVLLLATPVFANQNHGNSENAKENPGTNISQEKRQIQSTQGVSSDENEIENENDVTTTPTPTTEDHKKEVKAAATSTECDPNAEWTSHGAYVSCVAKLHLGGKTVSAAARSDIGKKNHATPSATPTITPTETPTATPTATVTPTPPLTSAEAEATFALTSFDNILKAIAHLFQNLPFLNHNA